MRGKKKTPKTRKQRLQSRAKRRAARTGLELSDHELENMVRDIQHGRGVFVRRITDRLKLWRITFRGQTILVTYNRTHKSIQSVVVPEL